jgi:hypothetical protein
MKALEVLIDGVSIGVFVPSSDATFAAALYNGPEESMVARVSCRGSSELSEGWLPTVRSGQRISFRMIDSPIKGGPEPQIIPPNIA